MSPEPEGSGHDLAHVRGTDAAHATLGPLFEVADSSFRNKVNRCKHAKFLCAWPMSADYASTEGMGTVNKLGKAIKNVV